MKKRLIYINLDGFGRYYYDSMPDKTLLPGLSRLMSMGVSFNNAQTGIPSITFPMQCAIVSGGYSNATGNCFAYLDREKGQMVQQRRYNKAQTAAELMAEQGLRTLSIQQFACEDKGCTRSDPNHLYIQPGGNCHDRFPILLNLLQSKSGEELPDAIFLYLDDLDSIGHNPLFCYADSEDKRIANVQKRLCEIDRYLVQMLDIMERRRLLDNTYILLTADHGMVSYRGSKIEELCHALYEYGFRSVRTVPDHTAVGSMPEVLLTGHSIQCQLYLAQPQRCDSDKLKSYLQNLPYVEQVLTAEQLAARGVASVYADMLISPVEGESLAPQPPLLPTLQASHDSLHSKCQHIFAVMAGPGLRQDYTETAEVHNIDFFPTMLFLMQLPPLRDATGSIIDSIVL
ncbi:MAG: alkaline phosphatase family protein [Angelakisella sp.]